MTEASAPEHREEVFNTELARILGQSGLFAEPELIIRAGSGRELTKKYPDVRIGYSLGLKLIIEGRFEGPGVESALTTRARERIDTNLCSVAVAIVYPSSIKAVPFVDISEKLKKSPLELRVLTEDSDGSWIHGDVGQLTEILRRTHEAAASDTLLDEAVERLDGAIEASATALADIPPAVARFSTILGVGPGTSAPLAGSAEARRTCRVAALVVEGALIFQELLSNLRLEGIDRQIKPIRPVLAAPDPISALVEEWTYILDHVDYVPIFGVARDLLRASPTYGGFVGSVSGGGGLVDAAIWVNSHKAALRHDLMGRIYHKLLKDAKYYGAFYTRTPAATLLAKLTFDPRTWPIDWSDLTELAAIRVCDPASGTGTLLKAALQSAIDNYVVSSVISDRLVDLPSAHQALVENSLYGLDVVPSAAHLAAATLAIHEPEARLRAMKIYYVALDATTSSMGSLDLLKRRSMKVQLNLMGKAVASAPGRVSGRSDIRETLRVPALDVCIMNPPFGRSSAANLLFGALPPSERKTLQVALKELVATEGVLANATAGFASVFVALGDQLLKPGGRLAMVLPKVALSGPAWAKTRQLLAGYRLDWVIVSNEPKNYSFSENDNLSQVMIIATKTDQLEPDCFFVNLTRQPRTVYESLALAYQLIHSVPTSLEHGAGVVRLALRDTPFGEVINIDQGTVRTTPWISFAGFSQTDLVRVGLGLRRGVIRMPAMAQDATIPLRPLGELFTLGPDIRDIHDGFETTTSKTAYPTLWNHASEEVQSMSVRPNRYLNPLAKPKPGRPLRSAVALWEQRGRIAIPERLRLNTHRIAGAVVSEEVLANTWWILRPRKADFAEAEGKAVILFMNSTLGLVSLASIRGETAGAFMNFKKPNLSALNVLDPGALSRDQLQALAASFDSLSSKVLGPISKADSDPIRREIDRSLSNALGLPDIEPIRKLFTAENWT